MELCDELVLQTWGNLDRSMSAAARLQYWRDTPYSRLRQFFVRVDGRMAARSWVRFDVQENLGSALLHVNVLDSFTGAGDRPGAAGARRSAGRRRRPDNTADLHGAPGRFRRRRPGPHPAGHRDRSASCRRAAASVSPERQATAWSRSNASARSTSRPLRTSTPWNATPWPARGTTNSCTGPMHARRNMPPSSRC